MENYEMPIGFGMALAMNPEAMQKFASLPESKKQEIINGTHSVSSKKEMQQYVENLLSMN
ncbi:MAG: YdeI/OmpD-associated family protein [Oscillospiraceae bacterium]